MSTDIDTNRIADIAYAAARSAFGIAEYAHNARAMQDFEDFDELSDSIELLRSAAFAAYFAAGSVLVAADSSSNPADSRVVAVAKRAIAAARAAKSNGRSTMRVIAEAEARGRKRTHSAMKL